MKTQYRKVKKYLDIVESTIYCNTRDVENITYMHCD